MKSSNIIFAVALFTSCALIAGKDKPTSCRNVTADNKSEYTKLIGCSAAIAIAKSNAPLAQQPAHMVTISPITMSNEEMQSPQQRTISPFPLQTMNAYLPENSPLASTLQANLNELPRYSKGFQSIINADDQK